MDTNIKAKLPKPKLRYHYLKRYWTCKGHGASTAATTLEAAYKAWVRSRAERRQRRAERGYRFAASSLLDVL